MVLELNGKHRTQQYEHRRKGKKRICVKMNPIQRSFSCHTPTYGELYPGWMYVHSKMNASKETKLATQKNFFPFGRCLQHSHTHTFCGSCSFVRLFLLSFYSFLFIWLLQSFVDFLFISWPFRCSKWCIESIASRPMIQSAIRFHAVNHLKCRWRRHSVSWTHRQPEQNGHFKT